jgi:predicted AAA+ superfamily ATPase
MLVGGMPEVVAKWVDTHDYLQCREVQDDIIISYEDDFPKYRKKVDPMLLRQTMRSAAVQMSKKFVYSQVGDYKTEAVKKALEMLILAGLLIPVTSTNANGLPLGSEADNSYRKILLLDSGLMLRLLSMELGNITSITSQILTANATDLINKGPMAELVAGLEILRYQTPNMRHELFYWTRQSKNSQAEVDYITGHIQGVLPIEIKAGTQGGMKSLWMFMRDKKLTKAVRCSLENFGSLDYNDNETNTTKRLYICPLYAVSMIPTIVQNE